MQNGFKRHTQIVPVSLAGVQPVIFITSPYARGPIRQERRGMRLAAALTTGRVPNIDRSAGS
eukprot:1464704-Pleurochrysis_carterae.AAC.2